MAENRKMYILDGEGIITAIIIWRPKGIGYSEVAYIGDSMIDFVPIRTWY